jgi:hypothetical protein
MADDPREYDRDYTHLLARNLQLRLGCDTDKGEVTRFFVQLEYRVDGDWREVVRYDHDSEGSTEATHDVTEEGLHIDIYRDGEVYRTEYVGPPMPASEALDRAEDHLMQNLEGFTTRFEQWHQINNP